MDHGAGDLDGPPLGLRHVIGALDPADQRILRTGLRQVMVQSREDKRQVRRLRQEAARLAAESNFDADTVSAAMARARAAELEGRARSEAILTDTLSKLSPEGRLKVVPVLLLRKRERMEPSGSNTPNGQKEDPGL
ncbi:MAG: periplasmic heavy metal sensor [Asticcacaulis sp.]